MSTYIIGDLQGCFYSLMRLLDDIHFSENSDQLWFVGDLVNRGLHSLDVLRFVQQLPRKIAILGNHDLHALAVHYGIRSEASTDHLAALLGAPDREALFHWLLHQQLSYVDDAQQLILVHAGLHSTWTPTQVNTLSKEVEFALQHQPQKTLSHLFSNYPNEWNESLTGFDRLNAIVNHMTRMRFYDEEKRLDFQCKTHPTHCAPGLIPWFEFPRQDAFTIFFGHWAALNGETHRDHIIGLDTGCVWGNRLTAYCLESRELHSVRADERDLKT